ncbi:MAG TPA: chorismate mutase [Gemmatimonadaceae bacterium]|nr:chorismate mutase [Gemmatimonadaceae bacterium]
MDHAPARAAELPSGARRLRAVRGATTVARDEPAAVLAATRELLDTLLDRNALAPRDVVSVIVTTTRDVTSADPSDAVRAPGWERVPVLCMSEIAVPDGLPLCVRVLLHVDVTDGAAPLEAVYLRSATALRPDLVARL